MNYKYQKMSVKEIIYLVNNNNFCVLGTSENDIPYLIPVYYESDYRDYTLVLKVNSKNYGKKVRYMNNNDNICVYFSKKSNNVLQTIIGIGKVFIEEKSSKNKNSEINIVIGKISGRKYNTCCIW